MELDKSAVIVIDFQNDFCHNDGTYGRAGYDPSMIQAAASKTMELLEGARRSKVPIIHVRTFHYPWTDSPSMRRRFTANWISKDLGLDRSKHCREGSWGGEFYLAPDPDECIVTKHRYSAFIETDLDLILRSIGAKTLVMTGCATNVCVESTARDGFMKDYFVVVAEDCAGAMTKEEHEASLYTLDRYFATVTNSRIVLQAWEEIASTLQ